MAFRPMSVWKLRITRSIHYPYIPVLSVNTLPYAIYKKDMQVVIPQGLFQTTTVINENADKS